jgi:hypothetical protein
LWTAVAVLLLAALAVGQAQEQHLDVYIAHVAPIQHTLGEEGYAKFLKTNAGGGCRHRDGNQSLLARAKQYDRGGGSGRTGLLETEGYVATNAKAKPTKNGKINAPDSSKMDDMDKP